MLESETEKTTRRPRYWALTREGVSHSDVLTIDPDGGGRALAVFCFREEAELFLGIEEMGAGWQVRETTAGELVSELYGPCADVERVMIDPLPRNIAGRTGIPPLTVNREDFTRILVETAGTAAGPIPALVSLRP